MFILIDGINIYFEKSETQGQPVLLLHGWGAKGDTMRLLYNSLETQSFCPILLDLPYFGSSDPPPEFFTVFDYASIVKKFIERLELKNLSIVAHSFGARLAGIIASDKTDKSFIIDKMVLTGAAGLKPKRGIKYRFRVWCYKLRKRLKLNTKNSGSSDYRQLPVNMKKVFVSVVNTNLIDYFASITKTKTLLLWGEKDKDTPLYMAKKLKKLIKNSEIVVLKNCSHYAFIDNYTEFNIITNAFLSG